MSEKQCNVSDCPNKLRTRGFCNKHYGRFRLYGDPTAGRAENGAPLAFLKSIIDTNESDCIDWPYGTYDGYGVIRYNKRRWKASRLVLILAGEQPAEKEEAAHRCGNAICVNPRHIRFTTSKENNADKIVHCTLLVGSKCPWAKLIESDIVEIRILSDYLLQKEIAALYGVKLPTINSILTRRSWRHV